MPTRKEMIDDALKRHHEQVKTFGFVPVMTMLAGSQNYGLDTEKSDYDTYTFVLPSLRELATLCEPVSTKFEDDLGHINIKDIRLALNLLKNSSPNSVEWFASQYRLVEPEYKPLFDRITRRVLRCNVKHMMDAVGGLARQLQSRNMPVGKRLSHILRMECMANRYFDVNADVLGLDEPERQLALQAKLDPENAAWYPLCIEHAVRVQEAIETNMKMNPITPEDEKVACRIITEVEEDFVRKAVEHAAAGSSEPARMNCG